MRTEAEDGPDPAHFDDAQLMQNAMENQSLAKEVLGLFLIQLPAMIMAAEQAADARDWALAAHTLKGSAALVGARSLRNIAQDLENTEFSADAAIRLLRLQALRAAAADFRDAARRRFPDAV
jgi:HPt (histidine-containing phosphotransfer) domain-containing protein